MFRFAYRLFSATIVIIFLSAAGLELNALFHEPIWPTSTPPDAEKKMPPTKKWEQYLYCKFHPDVVK